MADCNTTINEGDPAVEAYTVGGKTYFYISQITIPFNIAENGIGLNACQVVGSGSTATLSCNNTILAAISSDCFQGFFCSFLDKDFITIDPGRKRLYISYTEFGVNTVSFAGQVEWLGRRSGTSVHRSCPRKSELRVRRFVPRRRSHHWRLVRSLRVQLGNQPLQSL